MKCTVTNWKDCLGSCAWKTVGIIALLVITTGACWAVVLRHEEREGRWFGRGMMGDWREWDEKDVGAETGKAIDRGASVAPVSAATTVSSSDGTVTLTYAAPLAATTTVPDGIVPLATVDATLHTEFSAYHVPNYRQDGTIVISRDTNLTGIECTTFPEQPTKMAGGIKRLGGVQWNFASYSGTGMGNNYESTSYRLFLDDNTCYDVSTLVHSATDGNDIDQNAIDASLQKLSSLLDQAVQTISVKAVSVE